MEGATRLGDYRLSPEDVLKELRTRKSGLHASEAAERLNQYGANTLAVNRREPLIITFARQFKDLMIILLTGSSLVAFYLDDARTAVVLMALVLFNTTIGFLQEFKAGKVMESLEKLAVSNAVVRRSNKLLQISSSEVVVGDIVYIEEGSAVPADLRILTEDELSTNDFALTGESNPSRKFARALDADVPLAARRNLCFMGTTVATGHAEGIVIGTGMRTELGRIANLSQDIKGEASPLQKEMNNIAKRVTQGTAILCLALLPVVIQTGLPFKEALLFAIGIAASIVPNGLPAAISTSLAGAAGRLARAKALVKKLSAVETLGATSVICTDKTGTLTQNQMTVEQILVGRKSYKVTGHGYVPEGEIAAGPTADLKLPLMAGALASNARINPPDNEHATWYCIGDPTEGALITLAAKGGVNLAHLDTHFPELREFGFDSVRKRMSSLRLYGQAQKPHLFVKGAPESVLERCTHIWDHGRVRPLTQADKAFLLRHNEQLAAGAMRNLGLAYRILPGGADPKKILLDEAEQHLTWLGMASMIDPLRPDVPAAMEAARRAHIKVSIITGDNAVTARAIALRAKLTSKPEGTLVVAGQELPRLSDMQVLDLVSRGGIIFSRVSPEDKLRIVKLVQDSGQVVAVTGDGINDAPALKRADIGVAMGQTGTDVAKQSAEIVLLDDSFTTLVGAIQAGRVIFENIKKAALCCFTGNAAELVVNLFSLAAATALHIPLALTVIQILAIDVIAELFPVAALGGDKADRDVMRESPRDPKNHILNLRSVADLMWSGLLIGGLAFGNYIWFFLRHGLAPAAVEANSPIHLKATALTYLTLILCLLANVLLRRSRRGLFSRYQLHNKGLWVAMGLSVISIFCIIYVPWLAPYFHSAPLGFTDWLTALSAAGLFICIRELQLAAKRRKAQPIAL